MRTALKVPEIPMDFNIYYLHDKGLVRLEGLELGRPGRPPKRTWCNVNITHLGIDVIERIESLEKESEKEEPDQSRVRAAWIWPKDNANWIIPSLIDLLKKIHPSWISV